MDTDLADDATDKVDERFTEEDFDEELGAPTEVLRTAVFKLGSADQRGSATGSARGFQKVVIVCTVFNNLRPICFQICTHKSVTQSQCIAWKCCRGLA